MTYQDPKYPLFVDVQDAQAIVVGAGNVAERKIKTLLNYGAQVRVIAPEATPTLNILFKEERIDLLLRTYEPGDLADAFLVISATNDRTVNERVYREAVENKCLVNVVDVPDLCNFYVPSIVQRGPLQIAISTSGAAPLVAKQIRKEIEACYGDQWGSYVALLGEMRTLVLARIPGGEEVHKPIFTALVHSDLFERISAGEHIDSEQAYSELVAPFLEEGM